MSENSGQVFQTNSSKRYSYTKWTLGIIISILFFVVTVIGIAVVRGKNHSIPQLNSIRKSFESKINSDNKFTLATDLRANGSKLNTIYPEWFFINPKTFQLDSRIDKEALAVMKYHQLCIQPILNNFISIPGKQGNFSGDLLHKVLHNSQIQNQLIGQIIKTLKANNLQGINIDFEEMKESSDEHLNAFMKNLHTQFKQNGFGKNVESF